MRSRQRYHLIDGWFDAFGGGELLECRLGMLGGAALVRKVGFPQLEDESFGCLNSTVKEQCPDQCLDHIANHVVALVGAVLPCLLAQAHEGGDADLTAVLGAGGAVDEAIEPLRKIALGFLGIALIQCVRDHHSEHPVAEKLEPLVTFAAYARMSEREVE